MANVGNQTLLVHVVDAISKQLLESFAGTDKNLSKALVQELLSETEQRMLAKRFTAILMLIDEQSYYRIHQLLGMSTSTIKNLHKLLLAGTYSDIEKYVLHKKHRETVRAQIGLLLRGGLPPRAYVIKRRVR